MIKKASIGLLVLALSTTSCVSKKIYNDLESKYADLKKENRSMADENADLLKAYDLKKGASYKAVYKGGNMSGLASRDTVTFIYTDLH